MTSTVNQSTQSASTSKPPVASDPQSVAQGAMDAATTVGQAVSILAHRLLSNATATVGSVVAPMLDHPMLKHATKLPGIRWISAALGQVDVAQIETDIAKLRSQYPLETTNQLAHRIIVDTAVKGAGIGLVTNFVPPLALTLLAVDLAAIAQLQAEMIYHIAALYGFSLDDPARRGEVLALYGLSIGSSGAIKTGLSVAEIIPVIGTAIGSSSNAILLYSIGIAARQFYEEAQQQAIAQAQSASIPQ